MNERYCDKCCQRPAVKGRNLCRPCLKAKANEERREAQINEQLDRQEAKPHNWRDAFDWWGRR